VYPGSIPGGSAKQSRLLNGLHIKWVKALQAWRGTKSIADNLINVKTFSEKIVFGAVILTLVATGSHAPRNAGAQTQLAAPTSNTGLTSTMADNSLTPGRLPPNIDPNSPLGQVVRMAQAGVDQSIILNYVNNSPGMFNLDSDTIIYLNDIGVPTEIVTAMQQHDQQLGVATNTQPAQPAVEETPPPTTDVTENYFYDTLAPYGGWVNIEGYGLCWCPTVVIYNSSWQPYCDHGHWVYTDCGWYWMSDYSWGATTFHYGRWFHHPRYGWCWWPDTTWAPSWVCWRYSKNYCGWAPLPPHTVYSPGVGIVYNGVVVTADFNFGLSANFFTFVPMRNFCDPHLRRYRVAPARVTQIYSYTTIVNNFNFNNHAIVNSGIPPQRIMAISGVQIQPVAIHAITAPLARGASGERFGQNGQTLFVNRPHFVENAAPSLNQGIRPRLEVPNRNNNQNDLSQPVENPNSQPAHSRSTPSGTQKSDKNQNQNGPGN
jgi:hypothetical protein